MHVRPLRFSDHECLRRFLLEDTAANLFLLGVASGLQRDGDVDLLGVFSDAPRAGESLRGVVGISHGGLVVPWTRSTEDATLLGETLRKTHTISMTVGPRAPCDALWDALRFERPARLFYDQRLYRCEAPSPGEIAAGLRLATLDDAPVVADFASRMMMEDLGFDPAAVDAGRHRWAVEKRIRNGATWVVERSGRLVFKVDAGTCVREGVNLGGTYVPPRHRGQGIATTAMRGVIASVLRHAPLVALHVNEGNLPAVRVYERAGFVRSTPFRIAMAG